jgi:hypothetical protein
MSARRAMEVRNIRWVGVPAQNYAGVDPFRAPDGNLYELASRLR